MTKEREHIFVAGLGRCGTTAMMNMLAAGGVPCGGPPPSYEDVRLSHRGADLDWVRAHEGMALKWLDPHHVRLPPDLRARTIFLTRNVGQQARSQIKLVRTFGPKAKAFGKKAFRVMARGLRQETPLARAEARKHGPVLELRFEEIITAPGDVAMSVAAFLDGLAEFDPYLGVGALFSRSPKCRPDMAIEQALVEAHRRELRAASG
jgi:hypothetical protein